MKESRPWRACLNPSAPRQHKMLNFNLIESRLQVPNSNPTPIRPTLSLCCRPEFLAAHFLRCSMPRTAAATFVAAAARRVSQACDQRSEIGIHKCKSSTLTSLRGRVTCVLPVKESVRSNQKCTLQHGVRAGRHTSNSTTSYPRLASPETIYAHYSHLTEMTQQQQGNPCLE